MECVICGKPAFDYYLNEPTCHDNECDEKILEDKEYAEGN